jgi:hypothetical protein
MRVIRHRLLTVLTVVLVSFIISAGATGQCGPDQQDHFCSSVCTSYSEYCVFDDAQPYALCIQIAGGCMSIGDNQCCHNGGGF